MKGPKSCSVGGIAANQNHKVLTKFNLNGENNGIGDFSYNPLYSSRGGHCGDGMVEKSERGTPKELTRRHFLSEDGENDIGHYILIDNDQTTGVVDSETSIACHCGNCCGRNVESSHEERKRSYRVFENGAESNKHGKTHKLVAVPCDKYFLKEEVNNGKDKGNIYDECYAEKEELTDNLLSRLLNSHAIENTGHDYSCEPYVSTSKHIYCLNQHWRRRHLDEDDSYYITPPIDASVETSLTNFTDQLKDEDLIEELKRRKIELPERDVHKMEQTSKKPDKGVVEVKPQEDSSSEPVENKDDKMKLERKVSPLLGEGIEASEVPIDKEDKGKQGFVQEIKYYEGSLNIFGGEDNKDTPYLKITKIVTFEKDRGGKSGEKSLGIDSWMQTDGDYESEKESNISYGSVKNTNKNVTGLVSTLNEPYMETTKVCGECVKLLAGKYGGEKMLEGKFENPKARVVQDTRIDKSTSIEKRGLNVVGMELIKDDFVKFITELFLDAIPKEIYNRIMGGNNRLNNEEYEVRVKSYDKGSTESCNLKTCKMRNSDGRQVKGLMRNEKNGESQKNECICSDLTCGVNNGQARKPIPGVDVALPSKDSKSSEAPKKEGENTYDCQITLNGRKILVKVNKSVEDLLLSGSISNILRVSPEEDLSNQRGKQNFPPEQEGKNKDPGRMKMSGNCSCSDEMRKDIRKPMKGQQNEVNFEKGYKAQRGSTSGGARRGDSFTAIETGNFQKKVNSDYFQPGKITKPVVSSPPQYSSDGTKPDKSRNQDKNGPFNTTKNIFWSNVKVFNNVKEENALKFKKSKGSDCDPQNRVRSREEFAYKAYAHRRKSYADEKRNKHHERGNEGQSDECIPLYWESQYLKYCDRILQENGGCAKKTENRKPNVRDEKGRKIVQEIGQRMLVAPDFGQCNTRDTPRPLCIIKISDDDNCENPQCRDYTVANVTSMKLNSNPFDMGTITCRKCIETLQACSKSIDADWAQSKSRDGYGKINFCDYYWNRMTGKRAGVYSGVKGENSAKSDTTIGSNEYYSVSSEVPTRMHRKSRNFCCLNDQFYPNEEPTSRECKKPFLRCESTVPKVSCHKLNGICFSVTRVTRPSTPNIAETFNGKSPEMKNVGVSTTDIKSREIQMEKKTSFTQTTGDPERNQRRTTVEKQRSSIYFSVFRRGSKASLKMENSVLTTENKTKALATPDSNSNSTADGKDAPTETIKSGDRIQILLKNEDVSPSQDSIELEGQQKMEAPVANKKFSFTKSWFWRWKKKDKNKGSPQIA